MNRVSQVSNFEMHANAVKTSFYLTVQCFTVVYEDRSFIKQCMITLRILFQGDNNKFKVHNGVNSRKCMKKKMKLHL